MGAVVLRGTAGREYALTLRERLLYHQIHPAKLFADISTALIGIDLFWRHELAAGVIPRDDRLRLEYFEIVDPIDFQPVDRVAGPAVAAGALWVGATRLIDNLQLAVE